MNIGAEVGETNSYAGVDSGGSSQIFTHDLSEDHLAPYHTIQTSCGPIHKQIF